MRRREFIAGLVSAAAWPLAARAQQPAMPVIGFLSAVPGLIEFILPLFKQGLAETGYVVGRDVTIEPREGDRDRLTALAADLVRRNVMVIVAVGDTAALVAKDAIAMGRRLIELTDGAVTSIGQAKRIAAWMHDHLADAAMREAGQEKCS